MNLCFSFRSRNVVLLFTKVTSRVFKLLALFLLPLWFSFWFYFSSTIFCSEWHSSILTVGDVISVVVVCKTTVQWCHSFHLSLCLFADDWRRLMTTDDCNWKAAITIKNRLFQVHESKPLGSIGSDVYSVRCCKAKKSKLC